MSLRRALMIAAYLIGTAVGPAAAQFQAPPQAMQPPQQEPPCVAEFSRLRDDAQKKATAIRAASERKAQPKEACGLFNSFSAAESKLIKYAAEQGTWCGIPPQIITGMKQQHAKTVQIQTQVCRAAAAPPRPQGPSLSDTLGGSAVPDVSNIRTGRGTYDTLTGTPLGK
jgi:hypothetical protein